MLGTPTRVIWNIHCGHDSRWLQTCQTEYRQPPSSPPHLLSPVLGSLPGPSSFRQPGISLLPVHYARPRQSWGTVSGQSTWTHQTATSTLASAEGQKSGSQVAPAVQFHRPTSKSSRHLAVPNTILFTCYMYILCLTP